MRTQHVPEKPHAVFFDTVTLSNFALSRNLDLLIQRYGPRAYITPEVLDEVMDGIVTGYAELREVEDAVNAGRLGSTGVLSTEERESYRGLLRVLSPGEASCVSCAKIRGGIVATDDMAARECCTSLRVGFTGTIGILKATVLDGLASPGEADDILQAMVDAGYFSPVNRISSLL
jgi:predicted nucleic acid-binding protein